MRPMSDRSAQRPLLVEKEMLGPSIAYQAQADYKVRWLNERDCLFEHRQLRLHHARSSWAGL